MMGSLYTISAFVRRAGRAGRLQFAPTASDLRLGLSDCFSPLAAHKSMYILCFAPTIHNPIFCPRTPQKDPVNHSCYPTEFFASNVKLVRVMWWWCSALSRAIPSAGGGGCGLNRP